MALQCQMSLNRSSYSAGSTPAPMATLQVFNPNAVPVAVTGIALAFFDVAGRPINAAVLPPMPAMGPGQTVVAPALSSITFGPFPVVVGSGANNNLFLAAPAGSSLRSPGNIQLAMPPDFKLLIGAVVYGSDGSTNNAGVAALHVSYGPALPPPGFQGGDLQLANGNNLLTGLVMGVL